METNPVALKGKKFSLVELEHLEAETMIAAMKFERKKLELKELEYLDSLGRRVLKRVGAPEGAFKTAVRMSEDGRSVAEVEVIDAAPISEAKSLEAHSA